MSSTFSPACHLEHPVCDLRVDVGLCGADVSAVCLPDVRKRAYQSLVPLLSWPYQHFPASPEVSSMHLCSLSGPEVSSIEQACLCKSGFYMHLCCCSMVTSGPSCVAVAMYQLVCNVPRSYHSPLFTDMSVNEFLCMPRGSTS